MAKYMPVRGDIVALTFDPQSGYEQKGRRPALIVSHELFNKKTGLAIACPITHTDRKIPFHVKIPKKSLVDGFVMVEKVKSIDYYSRKAKLIEKSSSELLNEVLSVLDACMYSLE